MATQPDHDTEIDLATVHQRAVLLAAEILAASRQKESRIDRSRSKMMARMMNDAPGKKFTIAMADQVLRIESPERAAKRMDGVIEEYGIPRFLIGLKRAALWFGNTVAGLNPKLMMPLIKSQVRKDSAHVIISAEDKRFSDYLKRRRNDRIRVNFNQLGEAVLGEREAARRLRDNIQRLSEIGVDYVSIKLSSIASQIRLVGYQQTIETIKPKLREIYRAAMAGDGRSGQKFVNLDMEEYRDLHLTLDVFRTVLDEPEFERLEAGIVLQAYLPDSYIELQSLTKWARERFDRTGVGIKIRLVKGANLAMEQVEASMRHWPQAPYHSKPEVDANYKRLLEFASRSQNAEAVRIGVGSHNLFDISYAMVLGDQRGVSDRFEFEMLEGMANAQALEVRKRSGGLVVYTPVVEDADFESAIAYLVRRLDENTAPGSFLGALFALEEGTPEWKMHRDAFIKACEDAGDQNLSQEPNRKQDRTTETIDVQSSDSPFENVPDTDFSLPANRRWAEEIFNKWREFTPDPIPIQIAGEERLEKLTGVGKDPSRPGHVAYRFAQADADDVAQCLQTAVEAQSRWEQSGTAHRASVLRQAAVVFAQQRGNTIGAMLLDAGKNVTEADVEISEAIDFANYYSRAFDGDGWHDGTEHMPCGVVAVTPPWNFPYAIPAGGVLAALMAGNSVILKPARESVLTAWHLAQQLWEAGVPKEVLQFMPTVDGQTGQALISDERVAAVILTGSYFTAQLFQSWRPRLRLYAETSGKNSLIITAAADLDLAIKDLVQGAFGHSGQKCSATSLALVEREVYDSPKFIAQLKDAAESLVVAGSWNPSAVVTPVIREPDEYLRRGLTKLDEGEQWLLEPKMVDDNPCLWRPGIRLGVKAGSWYSSNECFGPVLGIIRADTFEQAMEIQNGSEFGLTGGLHSLDPKEIDIWREKVEVGNAYINRTTTGAIVRRQPFGGWKDSCVGSGPKAGGPNYVAAFCDWTERALPTLRAEPNPDIKKMIEGFSSMLSDQKDRERLQISAESYAHWSNVEFSKSHDPSQIHGETNHFRYRPRPWHLLRIQNSDDSNNHLLTAQLAIACEIVGSKLYVSLPAESERNEGVARIGNAEITIESDAELAQRLKKLRGGTMRIAGDYNEDLYAPANIGNIPIISANVLANGRIELLNYLKEQSVTETVHRYGNII